MIKAIALLKARPDLPRDEFMRYYETRHVPLARGILRSKTRLFLVDERGAPVNENVSG